ncbi:MAG: Gfo/Idh/MocA family oxidoreductase [Petrimonas sp.]|nr:Gfo/Idh/MocA family oxidoreductase [Petrimonas sp.]
MKKTTNYVLFVLLIILSACSSVKKSEKETNAEAKYLVKTDVPARPAGQQHVLGLATPKMDTVRVGFIGLGMRGPGAVERFTHIPGIKIMGLCDLYPERVDNAQKILSNAGLPAAAAYSGDENAWKQMCDRDDIDLIYIATDWKRHAPMMIYAMEQGKHVACEVPAAMTMEEIWDVINTAEKTQKHCMMLENCVYDFFELTTLNMIQKGVFGEVLYAEGAYIHQLEEFWDYYEGDWRMEYNKTHRGDVYPTHGIGPACQALNIHRGDKMNYLVSVDSDPVSIPAFLKKDRNEDVTDFKNGQHTVTLIRTENGKTIEIQHDVASPRPYSRMYQITGTKGFANKYPMEGYALQADAIEKGSIPNLENLSAHSFVSDEVRKALMEKYKHPIQIELEEQAKKVGGHGGMDFIMDYRLIYCLRNGLPLDMDVYDLAEWCCLVPLTAISLENGSAPVEIPDFTRGHWNDAKEFRHAFVEK